MASRAAGPRAWQPLTGMLAFLLLAGLSQWQFKTGSFA
jgi:hypothetical protein